jgi:peptidoglycan/xylan/chitin deacetylase (PgdA/CDA1 family)
MYHSISGGPGPMCIPVNVFRDHLAALAEARYQVISLAGVPKWHRNETTLPGRSVVITFDDGLLDFATNAFPELQKHRWTATVFLPTGRVGAREGWLGSGVHRLMNWSDIRDLSEQNTEFGAHTVSHVDLTSVSAIDAQREIIESKHTIEDQTGRKVTTFAPPYGRTNARVRKEIAKHFELSVGTEFARADKSYDIINLPRIEMYYFRNPRRWRDYLAGRTGYFALRRSLRGARDLCQRILPAVPTNGQPRRR